MPGRNSETLVRFRRCRGYLIKPFSVLGSVPLKLGCSDPLETSQRNTRENKTPRKEDRQAQKPQGPPENNHHNRATQGPERQNQGNTTRRETQRPKERVSLFLQVTSVAHTEPVGPCGLDVVSPSMSNQWSHRVPYDRAPRPVCPH